jgi:hypothetical protein
MRQSLGLIATYSFCQQILVVVGLVDLSPGNERWSRRRAVLYDTAGL